MSIPNVSGALRGWTKKQTAWLIQEQRVTDGIVKNIAVETELDMNIQPMPANQLKMIPEEERSAGWWSILIREKTPSLKNGDIVFVTTAAGRKGYKVLHAQNWGAAGYCRYGAQEYQGVVPEVEP